MMVSMATASNPKIWNKKFGILIIFYRHHNNRLEIFFFIVFFFCFFLNIKFNEKEIWFNIYKLIRFIFPIGIRVSTSWECSIYVCLQVVCVCVCVWIGSLVCCITRTTYSSVPRPPPPGFLMLSHSSFLKLSVELS